MFIHVLLLLLLLVHRWLPRRDLPTDIPTLFYFRQHKKVLVVWCPLRCQSFPLLRPSTNFIPVPWRLIERVFNELFDLGSKVVFDLHLLFLTFLSSSLSVFLKSHLPSSLIIPFSSKSSTFTSPIRSLAWRITTQQSLVGFTSIRCRRLIRQYCSASFDLTLLILFSVSSARRAAYSAMSPEITVSEVVCMKGWSLKLSLATLRP